MNNTILQQTYASYTGQTKDDTSDTTDNSLIKEQAKNYNVIIKNTYISINKNLIQNTEPTEEENIIKDIERKNYKSALVPTF